MKKIVISLFLTVIICSMFVSAEGIIANDVKALCDSHIIRDGNGRIVLNGYLSGLYSDACWKNDGSENDCAEVISLIDGSLRDNNRVDRYTWATGISYSFTGVPMFGTSGLVDDDANGNGIFYPANIFYSGFNGWKPRVVKPMPGITVTPITCKTYLDVFDANMTLHHLCAVD